MKKILLLIILISLGNILCAKSLVYIPTGVSADGLFFNYYSNTDSSGHDMSATIGYNSLELNWTNYSNDTTEGKYFSKGKNVLNGQWQILPNMGLVPAIAVGAKDITCSLAHSPAFYGVATEDFANYVPFLDKLAVTVGIGNDSLGFFGGLDVRLSCLYGSFEAYKKGVNYSCGLTFLDDALKIGYKRFNNNNYFGAECGFALNF